MFALFITFSGLIKTFGSESEVNSALKDTKFDQIFDAKGGCVIPGLIDGHTHPVWAGDRVHEFAMKVYFFDWFQCLKNSQRNVRDK